MKKYFNENFIIILTHFDKISKEYSEIKRKKSQANLITQFERNFKSAQIKFFNLENNELNDIITILNENYIVHSKKLIILEIIERRIRLIKKISSFIEENFIINNDKINETRKMIERKINIRKGFLLIKY